MFVSEAKRRKEHLLTPVQKVGEVEITSPVAMSSVKMQFLSAEILIIALLCHILFSTFDYIMFNFTLFYISKCIFIQNSV